MSDLRALVGEGSVQTTADGGMADIEATRRGELIIIDWYAQMAQEGRIYQVRAGTITTPIVGDLLITDSAAEMCADAASGTTIIPCNLDISVRLGTGILHEYAAKSVATASTAGTAFVPLNLKIGGSAATSTARAATAGGVSVTAELATTTRRHWSFSNPVAVGAGHSATGFQWKPKAPPVCAGPSCFYVQIAASGTGPSYYASFDYVELSTSAI